MASFDGKVQDEAFVTLATNDVYARGALVLAESLKMQGTTRILVVMITPQISPPVKLALDRVFDLVRVVDVLDSKDRAHLTLMKRPELGITFTKLHCWTLTQFKKCVFMDADMMVLQNIDDLFEREELSAARDSGWPDIFNSGLFVFCPSMDTFNRILKLADAEGSFDGGDQGLLNSFFSDWSTADISRHIPFLYNLHITASYTYLPAFKKFGKDTKVVHFLGTVKPWHHVYDKSTGRVKQVAGSPEQGKRQFPEFLSEWWAIYNEKCQKYFSAEQEMNKENCAVCIKLKRQTSENQELSVETPFCWELPNTFFKTTPHYEMKTLSLDNTDHSNGPHEIDPLDLSHGGVPNNEVHAIHATAPADDSELGGRIFQSLAKVHFTNSKVLESSPLHDMSSIPRVPMEDQLQTKATPSSAVDISPEDQLRAKWDHKSRWESGNIDYAGEDKFENIQALLDTYL